MTILEIKHHAHPDRKEKAAMSSSTNKVILSGTLAGKPVTQAAEGDRKMVGLLIMTMRPGQDSRSGEKQARQEWHRIVITHERLAAFAEVNLDQGDEVYLKGELQTDVWQSETLDWRALTKIVLSGEAHQLRRLTGHDQERSTQHYPILDQAA